MNTLSPTLAGKSIGAILNTASGSCTPECEAEMQKIFQEAGIPNAKIWCTSSAELAATFSEVQKSNLDVLVVLGGDGTIRSAAERFGTTLALIPLPGGTMNVLPRALYGSGSWPEVLQSILANPSYKKISGGEVAGRRFYISAICGAPALFAHAREAWREHNLEAMIEHGKTALEHLFASKITYHFNEMHEGTTEALTVTCPLVSTALEEDRTVFEAAVIDVNHAGEVLELATAAAFGEWRESKNVAIVRTDHVTVSSTEDVPIILDGESIDAGKEVTIEFVPEALCCLVPAA